MAIDQQSSQPLRPQLVADIRRRITSNEFELGKKIPSLRSLAEEYNVAELTVHAAIRELQQGGILESVPGKGTFVARVPDPTDESREDRLEALSAEVADLRERVEALEKSDGR